MLQGALEAASFSLDPADDQALREIKRQVEAVAAYFTAACRAPEHATLSGYNPKHIPAGAREERNRLAEALSDKLGVVGACRAGDSEDSDS